MSVYAVCSRPKRCQNKLFRSFSVAYGATKKGSAAVLVWTLTMTWVEEEELTAEMQSIAGATWQL